MDSTKQKVVPIRSKVADKLALDRLARHEEYRLERVKSMLAADPNLNIASMTDSDSIPGIVIVTVAMRGKAAFDIQMPAEKYSPFSMIDLINNYSERPKK